MHQPALSQLLEVLDGTEMDQVLERNEMVSASPQNPGWK